MYHIYPIDGNNIERRWRFAKESVEEIKDELVVKKDSDGLLSISRAKINYVRKTVWTDSKHNANIYGTQLLSQIISEKFPFPKSLHLVKECVLATEQNKNAIVLDFFAGSGTTGHAVLELNKEDGGNRRFILCTNNESNICEEVTYPRIYNVMKGYKFKGKDKKSLYEKTLTFSTLTKSFDKILQEIDLILKENNTKYDDIESKIEDNIIKISGVKNINSFKDGLGSNLQYFKTDLIPVGKIDKINDKQRHELTEKAGQMIAIKENTFEELTCNKWYQIFESKDKTRKTAIYFREDMDKFEELVKKINGNKTILYVFSYGRIDKKIFKYLGKNITIEDIPEPILEIYKELNLTIKEK